MGIIWFLLIGALAGFLAGKIMEGKGRGFWMNMVIGVIGAVIGGVVFDFFKVDVGGLIGSIITATVGAIILLFIASKIRS